MIYKQIELEKNLNAYSQAGFRITPVAALTKRPATRGFLKTCTADYDLNVKLFQNKHFGDSLGLCLAPSGLVAIDIDVKNDGLQKWQAIILKHGDVKTLRATTGSGGGHLVFRAKAGMKYKGKISDGIDIRHNHIIVVEPSFHYQSGKQYRWNSEVNIESVMDYPDWLATYIEKPSALEQTSNKDAVVTAPELHALVTEIQKCNLDYDQWIKVGMALKVAMPNDEGMNLFLQATNNKSYKDGDYALANEKWVGFSTDKNENIGVGTIVYILKEKKADLSSFYLEKDRLHFSDKNDTKNIEDILINSKIENQYVVFENQADLVKSVNNLGYHYLTHTQAASFAKVVVSSKDSYKDILCMNERKLKADLYSYKLKTTDRKGVVKYKDADSIWSQSRNKNTKERISFSPISNPNELNLWNEILLKPMPGDCSQFLKMIEDSVCNENSEHYKYLISFCAHMIQKPEQHVFVVPILYSEKEGTGKGLLFDQVMKKILGQKHLKIRDAGELGAKFNSHLANRLLTLVDEVSKNSADSILSKLKSLVGGNDFNVEFKQGPVLQVENFSRYVIATNEMGAIKIAKGNRRFFVIQSSNKFANNKAYFAPIIDALNSGNLANYFYDYLLKFNIDNFDPNLIPDQKNTSIDFWLRAFGDVGEFWEHLLYDAPLILFDVHKGLDRPLTYEKYLQFSKKPDFNTPNQFWKETKKLLPCLTIAKSKQHRGQSGSHFRTYDVTPKQCLDSFCATINCEPPIDFQESDYYFEEIPEFGRVGYNSQSAEDF